MWFFYAPFVPYWFWNSLKSGSFSYFCKVNPGIEFGGFLDYSKSKILDQIPSRFKPKTRFYKTKSDLEQLPEFPFVVKPDFGERGVNVELIRSEKDWKNYPDLENIIVQEYLDLPMEFGFFYARSSANQAEVLSITGKEFLVYISDGKSTLESFVLGNPRSSTRTDYFKEKFKEDWLKIHPKGRKIFLEPIGNHNRGTKFFDASHLITNELTQRISEIANRIEGFYYGRFDVKANSEFDLMSGNFKVLEINGANSEPTHIYDPEYSLWKAYREVRRHFDIQYQISRNHPKTYSSLSFYKSILKRIFRCK